MARDGENMTIRDEKEESHQVGMGETYLHKVINERVTEHPVQVDAVIF